MYTSPRTPSDVSHVNRAIISLNKEAQQLQVCTSYTQSKIIKYSINYRKVSHTPGNFLIQKRDYQGPKIKGMVGTEQPFTESLKQLPNISDYLANLYELLLQNTNFTFVCFQRTDAKFRILTPKSL